jgi:two-component system, OmpR family, phosphate regulon sensor histidine kinase PhoR
MNKDIKFNLRLRLLTILVISILISAFSVGFFLFQYFDGFLHQQVESNLQKYLAIAEYSLDKKKIIQRDDHYLKQFSDNFSRLFDCRITIIDTLGKVIADSDVPNDQLFKLENHSTRPEVLQSQFREYGSAVRQSVTLGESLLYMAENLKLNDQHIGYLRLAIPVEMFAELLSTSRNYFLIAGICVLLISSILVGIFSKKISSNFFEILSKANAIASGNLDTRIKIDSKDELAALSGNLNDMAVKLSDSLNKLHRDKTNLNTVLSSINDGIIAIDHQKKISFLNQQALTLLNLSKESLIGTELGIATNNAHLNSLLDIFFEKPVLVKDDVQVDSRILDIVISALNISGNDKSGAVIVLRDVSNFKMLEKIRREFVANVSHEFKTPIAAIRGYAETLLDWGLKDKKIRQKYTKNIVKQSQQLENLVSDLLALARIEKMQSLEFSVFDPLPIISDVVEEMKENAREKQLNIKTSFPDESFKIYGDPEMFRSIMINLIDNAIKYTAQKGSVDIESGIMHGQAFFNVKDTGIGIPEKDQPRIFERFYRVDKARSRDAGGTGLGLSIVKHLVELQKAEIFMESKVNAGSSFKVWFNLS